MIDASIREIMKECRFELFLGGIDLMKYYIHPQPYGRTNYGVVVARRNGE